MGPEAMKRLERPDALAQAQQAAELRRLHAENEALRVRLGHIAAVSHEGGLAGHDSIASLVCVRKLSLAYWDRPGTLGGRLKHVQDAVSAAMKERTHG